ncbi:DUF4352 domain-containing protein [Enterococcus rotai]|uniref:DUF4352 domain-containing protein n=1 Tax=Enterococcus rotai TaxID=118060 RepID=UPI0032B4AD32
MKKVMLTIGLGLSLLLVGCNAKTNNVKDTDSSGNGAKIEQVTKKDGSKAEDKGTPVVVDGIEITISDMQTREAVGEKQAKQTLYSFHVKGKNISFSEKGLGSIDFILKTKDGKEHTISENYNIFGDGIDENEEIEGDLYFLLDNDAEVESLEYKPLDDVLMTWELN